MKYEIPQPARQRRMFSKVVRYSEIDWGNLEEIIQAYRTRILDWYLEPAEELAKNPHFAFSVMALSCLLIETLGQFVFDQPGRGSFKSLIRGRLPARYSAKLQVQIEHLDGDHSITLEDVADVIYHAFRCGILHQAHMPPYAGVDPGLETPVEVRALGLVRYKSSGANCPSVILNPLSLLADLRSAFEAYLGELTDPATKYLHLRKNFKSRFTTSFGIDISRAILR